jgi:uncharacterized protein YlbG (UPF0298 family)
MKYANMQHENRKRALIVFYIDENDFNIFISLCIFKFVFPFNLSLPFSGSVENNKRCFFMTQYNVFLLPHDVMHVIAL